MNPIDDLYRTIGQSRRAAHANELLAAAREQIDRTLESHRDAERKLRPSVARMLQSLQHAQPITGADGEYLQEYARQRGTHADPTRPEIPLELFARDLIVATNTIGGYLADKRTPTVADALRPWSVVTSAGVTLMPDQSSALNVPRQTATGTAVWLANEGSQATESTPVLGSTITLSPKNVGAYTELSRQLVNQGGDVAEFFIRRELLGTIGQALDAAVLNGAGTGGEPTGIIGTANVQTTTGTSLTWAGALDAHEKAATAGARDAAIAWVSTPAVREVLGARTKESGSGQFIWADDMVNNRPAYVTTDCPSAKAVVGDFAQVLVPMWGGVIVELNPFANFPAGIVGFRLLVSCEVGVLQPASFVCITSIS